MGYSGKVLCCSTGRFESAPEFDRWENYYALIMWIFKEKCTIEEALSYWGLSCRVAGQIRRRTRKKAGRPHFKTRVAFQMVTNDDLQEPLSDPMSLDDMADYTGLSTETIKTYAKPNNWSRPKYVKRAYRIIKIRVPGEVLE